MPQHQRRLLRGYGLAGGQRDAVLRHVPFHRGVISSGELSLSNFLRIIRIYYHYRYYYYYYLLFIIVIVIIIIVI